MVMPSAKWFAILEEHTLGLPGKTDLESDPSFIIKLITLLGRGLQLIRDKVKASGRGWKIVSDETMLLAECIYSHSGIRCSICAKLVGFEDMGVDSMTMYFIT